MGETWQPQFTALTVGYLELDSPKPRRTEQRSRDNQPDGSRLPGWLPSKVSVTQFDVALPCENRPLPSGRKSVDCQRTIPINANVQLNHEGHQVGVLATLDGSLDNDLTFSAKLTIDGTRYLSASHTIATGMRAVWSLGTALWKCQIYPKQTG